MNFADSIKTCLSKYAVFNGRASRPEYWWFFLFFIIGGIVTSIMSETVSIIFYLAVLLPTIAVTTRRLHDTDRSGWYQLIGLIPLIGLILLYFLSQKGKEPNRFGEGITSTINSPTEDKNDQNEQIYRVINNDQNKIIDLTKTITKFCNTYPSDKSKNIWCLDQIPNDYIEKHKNKYLKLDSNEKVLVLLNKGAMLGNVFSGLLITNTCIHFCTLKSVFN